MTQPKLEVILSPAEFGALQQRDLSQAVCVVFDVLRATTSMITALANGAEAIIPVGSIEEALALRRKQPDILLAGERNSFKIKGFDLSNSPREMTLRQAQGKLLAMTTTNGTVALRACRGADTIYVAALLNLPAIVRVLAEVRREILFVCAGTHERFAAEDIVCAGAMIARLTTNKKTKLSVAAKTALRAYKVCREDFMAALSDSENGRRLLSIPALAADVKSCAQLGRYNLLAQYTRGCVIATSARD
jgi:2-phosphosulfolactate phosphatase